MCFCTVCDFCNLHNRFVLFHKIMIVSKRGVVHCNEKCNEHCRKYRTKTKQCPICPLTVCCLKITCCLNICPLRAESFQYSRSKEQQIRLIFSLISPKCWIIYSTLQHSTDDFSIPMFLQGSVQHIEVCTIRNELLHIDTYFNFFQKHYGLQTKSH